MVLPSDEKIMSSSKKSKKLADACPVHGSLRKNSKSKDLLPSKDPERKNSFDSEILDEKNKNLCSTSFDIVVECNTTVNSNQSVMKEEIIKENSKNAEAKSFDKDNSIKNTIETTRDSSQLKISSTSDEKITNIRNEDTEKKSDDMKHKTKLAKHIDSSNGKYVENNNADTNSLASEIDVDRPESKTSHVSSRLKNLPQLQNYTSDYSKPNSIPISQSLKSPMDKANNSIYKLSYAESLTDRSGSESRSVSPTNDLMDPTFYIPKSVLSDEIIVYDGGSDAESGPEDLEMNPQIYESPLSNKSKHLYENELSLAVELLRTKESLPYDDEFKKIVENSVERDNESDDDSLPPLEDGTVITNQCRGQNNMSIYHNPFEDLCSSCELALDAKAAGFKGFEDGEMEVPSGFRRSAGQFIRHYFSPCSVDNCCIIM